MSSSSSSPQEPNEDLDAFLIGIESKLRTPFSSLDLSRAVAGNPSPRHYLHMISKVLPRMDKVVQLRVLVGLLGIEPSEDTDDVIHEILTQTQEAPLFEEWVRVAAGLVQGMLFSRDTADRDVGQEAQSLLEKTCRDIFSRATPTASATSDMDPMFAPYYYSLINPDTLQSILPECMTNPHFTVNTNADILKVDERKEQEEPTMPVIVNRTKPSAAAPLPAAIMPGRATTTSKKPPPTTKSSMFLTAKKPIAAAALSGRQVARKPGLHTRKAGAAQLLLGKSRRPAQTANAATGGAGTSATATTGRTPKFGNNRSKMKMIDVSEVQGLTKERQERETKMSVAETREQKLSARKRKIMEAAAAKGLVASAKQVKRNKPNEGEDSSMTKPASEQAVPPTAVATTSGDGHGSLEATAAAALLAYQQQRNGGHQSGDTAPTPAMPPSAPKTLDADRKSEMNLLLENSNKITVDDRFRVKQFFIDRFNPTPEVPVYKVKLHEEKKLDPETGMTVKETYYVELDYNTFGYRKLRKTKKK